MTRFSKVWKLIFFGHFGKARTSNAKNVRKSSLNYPEMNKSSLQLPRIGFTWKPPFSTLSNREIGSISSGENGHFWSFSRELVWQKGHTWLSKSIFYLETHSACAYEYIVTVGVNEALSFLSTFILYIVYCFMTNKCVLKPKLWQGYLILSC